MLAAIVPSYVLERCGTTAPNESINTSGISDEPDRVPSAGEIIGRYLIATGRTDALTGVNSIIIKRSAYYPDTGDTVYHTVYSK